LLVGVGEVVDRTGVALGRVGVGVALRVRIVAGLTGGADVVAVARGWTVGRRVARKIGRGPSVGGR